MKNTLSAEDYIKNGIKKYELGSYIEAIKDFDKSIEIEPNVLTAYFYRRLCNELIGVKKEALLDKQKCIEIEAKNMPFVRKIFFKSINKIWDNQYKYFLKLIK